MATKKLPIGIALILKDLDRSVCGEIIQQELFKYGLGWGADREQVIKDLDCSEGQVLFIEKDYFILRDTYAKYIEHYEDEYTSITLSLGV